MKRFLMYRVELKAIKKATPKHAGSYVKFLMYRVELKEGRD